MRVNDFLAAVGRRGYGVYTGVPCSFLTPLINGAIGASDTSYIAASSEGEAAAIALGSYLAGRPGVVLCQNSGLGNMVNPLASLHYPFRIPSLLVITLRGEPGLQDEPQHELMGRATSRLLDALEIPWADLPDDIDACERLLDQASERMGATRLPFALLVHKGTFDPHPLTAERREPGDELPAVAPKGAFVRPSGGRMPRRDALAVVRDATSESDVLIGTTGKLGRELFSLGDRDNQLYVVGGMGCAPGIGLGIQMAQPSQRVVVLDGDGALLMKMGSLGTIGHYRPHRFVHVVFDNETYDSTGGQSTVSSTVDFAQIAASCGYVASHRVDESDGLAEIVMEAARVDGPCFVHVKVAPGSSKDLPRPNVTPQAVQARLRGHLGATAPTVV